MLKFIFEVNHDTKVSEIEYKLISKIVHDSCCISVADYFAKYSTELSVLERKLHYPIMERELSRLFYVQKKACLQIYEIIKAKHASSV